MLELACEDNQSALGLLKLLFGLLFLPLSVLDLVVEEGDLFLKFP